MQSAINKLNKLFDNRMRLGIMSALVVSDTINFVELKELLSVTDGNLASHLKALEESKAIKVNKAFIGRKTNTTYTATKSGLKAFRMHIDALEEIIRKTK